MSFLRQTLSHTGVSDPPLTQKIEHPRRAGAPDAIQVADRWHIWHNLCGYAATAVSRHRAELDQVHPRPAPVTGEDQLAAVITARWEQVQALRARGGDLPAAAAALGLGTATASRYWNAAGPATLLAARAATSLDPWKPYLRQQWEQGTTRITVLHRQITALGYQGSYGTTLAFLTRWKLAAPPPPPAPPDRHQAARLILADPARLSPADKALLDAILARCPAIAALASHITAFAAILTSQDPSAPASLTTWTEAVSADADATELRSFAHGLHQDRDAVSNALTLTWNSGKVEGHVNRIKLIKRQAYGRARLPLLRKRILLTT